MFSFDSLKGSKALALLLDPHKTVISELWINLIKQARPDIILVGGSQPFPHQLLDNMVKSLKANLTMPVVGFPGTINQIHPDYDALLALSVVQSTESQFILSPIFQVASFLDELKLPAFFTAYLILGNTGSTAVEKVLENKMVSLHDEQTLKSYFLGLKIINPACVYLEAGSGSAEVINYRYISVAKNILLNSYLFAGGGVRSIRQAEDIWCAGADCLVIGNWIEDSQEALIEVSKVRNRMNKKENLV